MSILFPLQPQYVFRPGKQRAGLTQAIEAILIKHFAEPVLTKEVRKAIGRSPELQELCSYQ